MKCNRVIFPTLIAFLLFMNISQGGDLSDQSGERLRQISEGGRLYDKWWAELDMSAPKTTHPSYPEAGKKKGASTWRCKECHGWDYKGKRGAYRAGSHFTGILGIQNMVGASEQEVVAVMENRMHRFGSLIPRRALEALAAFVVDGQVEMDDYIVRETKRTKGDPVKGGRIYQTICAICHGIEGKGINFGDVQKPQYVGTIANKNPWETLHKIRMGQPGKKMPPLLVFSIQEQADILAYTQTLPQE